MSNQQTIYLEALSGQYNVDELAIRLGWSVIQTVNLITGYALQNNLPVPPVLGHIRNAKSVSRRRPTEDIVITPGRLKQAGLGRALNFQVVTGPGWVHIEESTPVINTDITGTGLLVPTTSQPARKNIVL